MNTDQVRVIKKYPNRRLYDTEQSSYITLADIKDLAVEDIPFKVVDTQSGNDITRNILLQVIVERESNQNPLFSTNSLLGLVRNYGFDSQDAFTNFMDQSLDFFQQQRQTVQVQMKDLTSPNLPLQFWTEVSEKNLQFWKEMQNNLFQGTSSSKTNKKKKK